jgi:hypothetical protein
MGFVIELYLSLSLEMATKPDPIRTVLYKWKARRGELSTTGRLAVEAEEAVASCFCED